jgi:hypothetical protein
MRFCNAASLAVAPRFATKRSVYRLTICAVFHRPASRSQRGRTDI